MNCNDTSPKAIGERIKSARENCKMTQKELAKKLICTRELISYYENGSRDIKTDTLIRLSDILGVTTDYLLGLSRAETKDITVASICDYTGLSERSIDNLNTYKKYPDIIEFIDTIIANSNIFTNLSHYASEYFDSLRRCKELKEKYPDHLIESPHIHLPTNTETFSVDEKHEAEERELHGIYRNEVENVQPLQLYKLQNFFMDFIKDYGEAILKDGE